MLFVPVSCVTIKYKYLGKRGGLVVFKNVNDETFSVE